MKSVNVTIYSDYVCPYCYIGAARVRKLEGDYGATATWKSFELHPEAPSGGIPPSMFYQNDPNLKRISENARRLAAEADLRLGAHVIYSNSRLALELGEFAEQSGKGKAFRSAIFDAYFQQIRDIGDDAVLLAVAEDIGLSQQEAAQCLAKRTMKAIVDSHIQEAKRYGITGVPTFLIGEYMLVGAQPYPVIKRAFEMAMESSR